MYGYGYSPYFINTFLGARGGAGGYLVDTYSPTAAYSLRKLSSSATNAIRVRRSSDNAEQDIGFSGNDLDTASLSSFVSSDSAYIVTWYDQAGSFNLTQSTAANQPRIVNAGTIETKNSLPTAYFDGSNDRLISSVTVIGSSLSTSYFSVSAPFATETVGTVHSHSTASTNCLRTYCDSRTATYRNMGIGVSGTQFYIDLSAPRVDTNQRVLSSFVDASKNMSGFDNGATGGTNTYTGTSTSASLFQLGSISTGTSFLNGYIQEFIAFNTDETANRTDIEANINSYYSIY